MSMDKVQILNIESEEMKQVGTISMDAMISDRDLFKDENWSVCMREPPMRQTVRESSEV